MIEEILDKKTKKVKSIQDDEIIVIKHLLEILLNKYLFGAKSIKMIKYDYSYTDMQDIYIYFDEDIKVFKNIKTRQGYFDIK